MLGSLAIQRGWLTTNQLREFGPGEKPRTPASILIERDFMTAHLAAHRGESAHPDGRIPRRAVVPLTRLLN